MEPVLLWEKIINDNVEKKSSYICLLKPLFYILSLLFGVIVEIRILLYKLCILPSYKLNCKVISVGNLSVGGTGKTPVVIYIANYLAKYKHLKVGIISRGYKRKTKTRKREREKTTLKQQNPHFSAFFPDHFQCLVVSENGRIITSVELSGDEPYLIAKKCPFASVIVSSNRVLAGKYAINELGCNLIILDDAFQHLKIKRDIDIVLIDSITPNQKLLPAGYLREPIKNISRANVVWWNEKAEQKIDNSINYQVSNIKYQEPTIKKQKSIVPDSIPQIFSKYEPTKLIDLITEKDEDINTLQNKRVVALSGIANPSSFEKTLKNISVDVIKHFAYTDHHWFSNDEIKEVIKFAIDNNVNFIITTEKDAVRIDSSFINNCDLKFFALVMQINIVSGWEILEKMIIA